MRGILAGLLLVSGVAWGQIIERPKIGVKLGIGFSDTKDVNGTDKSTRFYFGAGVDVSLSALPIWGGLPRIDGDLFYGPGSSSLFRVGLTEIWHSPSIVPSQPYFGLGAGFLFADKRGESDRRVLSVKLLGGVTIGKNLFVEAAILQSSRTDAVIFEVGQRF